MRSATPRPWSLRLGLGLAGALALAGTAAAQTTAIGLSSVRSQHFDNEDLSGIFTPQQGDLFAYALAAGDFDGNGTADLATGMPGDNGPTDGEIVNSGSVVVRYSTRDGLTDAKSQVYVRQTPYPDPPDADDFFGSALAACDFNGDRVDDLAVGIPSEDHLGQENAGAIQVHYGTYLEGLSKSGDLFFTQSTDGVPGDVEEFDYFGSVLACGDFDGDGFADLAIGVFRETFESWLWFDAQEGMVVIVPGSPVGLVTTESIVLHQDVDGIGGSPEPFDWFGYALAAGDFDADSFDDLAIGVPEEDDHGTIVVVFGGPTGLTTTDSLFWSEKFVGGTSEDGDGFGAALAAADFDGDGFDDLAVGTPGEDIDGVEGAGGVVVLYGAPNEFDRTRTQLWDENTIVGAGASEEADEFGFELAAGDFDKDGAADLAIGHPNETVSGPKVGALTALMGSPAGLTADRHRSIVGGFEGFPGDASQAGKSFAFALVTGDFDGDGHADLAVGSPTEDGYGVPDIGAEAIVYGALFADGVETADTALWSETVTAFFGNQLLVKPAARLGPLLSRHGLVLKLEEPTRRVPATPAYVRVGTEAGFASETRLSGTFFINPQNLAMSTSVPNNSFQMMAFSDGLGARGIVRLIFFLVRNPADGDWFINVFHYNETLNTFQFSGNGFFALDGDPAFSDNRIDFEWQAGNPGRLTMRRTRYANGVPDGSGTHEMFTANLPGTAGAVINHAFVGMFAGHRPGTSGLLFLDEISFRR